MLIVDDFPGIGKPIEEMLSYDSDVDEVQFHLDGLRSQVKEWKRISGTLGVYGEQTARTVFR